MLPVTGRSLPRSFPAGRRCFGALLCTMTNGPGLNCVAALFGVLQNDTAPMIIDEPPFFDLLQRSKAAEAGKLVVQAAIADAGGLSGASDFTHSRYTLCHTSDWITRVTGESEQSITRAPRQCILTTAPPFITKVTCSTAVISSSGEPGTAMISAK